MYNVTQRHVHTAIVAMEEQ